MSVHLPAFARWTEGVICDLQPSGVVTKTEMRWALSIQRCHVYNSSQQTERTLGPCFSPTASRLSLTCLTSLCWCCYFAFAYLGNKRIRGQGRLVETFWKSWAMCSISSMPRSFLRAGRRKALNIYMKAPWSSHSEDHCCSIFVHVLAGSSSSYVCVLSCSVLSDSLQPHGL